MKFLKKHMGLIGKAAISLAIVVFLLRTVSLDQLAESLKGVYFNIFFLGLITFASAFFLGSLRWRILLKAQKHDEISIWRLLRLTLIGLFFNNFLLGTNGGDIIKAVYLAKTSSHKKTSVVTTIFMDRLVGFLSFLTLSTAMVLLNYKNPDLRILLKVMLICYLMIFMFCILFLSKKITKKFLPLALINKWQKASRILRDIYNSIYAYKLRKRFLISAFCVSLCAQLFLVLAIYILGISLEITVAKFADYLTLVPIIQTLSALPISLSGLGLTEGLYVYFFNLVGVVTKSAFALSVLIRICAILWGLLGGAVYLFK
ncbi:flippase-like domain-containing protein [bacterium]|nr:flippase-like domain-containing protein [bacterium]